MNATLWITLVALGLGLEPETDTACEYVATYAYDRAEASPDDGEVPDAAWEDTWALCIDAVNGRHVARAYFLAWAGQGR